MENIAHIYRACGLCDNCWWSLKETGTPSSSCEFFTAKSVAPLLTNTKDSKALFHSKVGGIDGNLPAYTFKESHGWTKNEAGLYEKRLQTSCWHCLERSAKITFQAIPVISAANICKFCHSTNSVNIEILSAYKSESGLWEDRLQVLFYCRDCGKIVKVEYKFHGLADATTFLVDYNDFLVRTGNN